MLNTLLPSREHPFGTDQLGRDVFSRVITGSRDILTVAPLATLLGTLGGTVLGLAMGYSRGIVDEVLSRIVDALLALPTVIVALLALVALGTSKITVVLVIAFGFTPIIARTVRAAVLAERELDYVAAASCGWKGRSISCSSRSCPMSRRPFWSRRRCGSATPSSRSRR